MCRTSSLRTYFSPFPGDPRWIPFCKDAGLYCMATLPHIRYSCGREEQVVTLMHGDRGRTVACATFETSSRQRCLRRSGRMQLIDLALEGALGSAKQCEVPPQGLKKRHFHCFQASMQPLAWLTLEIAVTWAKLSETKAFPKEVKPFASCTGQRTADIPRLHRPPDFIEHLNAGVQSG